jgi:PAS domain S-box-containing protein
MNNKQNILSLRLAVWFLLLSIFPIMILIFFIQPNITALMLHVQQQNQINKLKYAANNLSTTESDQWRVEKLAELFGQNTDYFIIDENLIYQIHSQPDQIGKSLTSDYSADDIASYIQQYGSCAVYHQEKSMLCSEIIPSTTYTLVIRENIQTYLEDINAIHQKSIVQLGVSLLIMSFATAIVIWLLVGKPIRQLTQAAINIGKGDFSGIISTDIMNDELEVLGKTFNAMSTYIAALISNQEDKIKELAIMSSTLEKNQENLRTFFLSLNDFVFVFSQNDEIIYTNRLVEDHLGYANQEILGVNINTIFIRSYNNANSAPLFLLSRNLDSTDGYLICKDGEIIEIEMKLSHGLWNDQPVVFGIARNISERVQAEKEINKQLQRLESLHRIDKTITGTMDLAIIMNVLLSQINQQLNILGSTVLLYDKISHQLSFYVEQGFNFTGNFKQIIHAGEGLAGKTAISRQISISENVSFDTSEFSIPPFLAERQFKTVYDIPLIAKGELKGVLELYSNNPPDEDPNWHSFLATLATQAALAIDNTTLFKDLQKTNTELFLAYDITLEGWVKTLELRELESHQHAERTTDLMMTLVKSFGFHDATLSHIRRGALLHDIGKLGIPDQILNKPGPLTEKEWEIVKQHPVIAYDLLSRIPFLKPALSIPYSHHERWDGSGYPLGLSSNQIPLEARIFAIIDVWDSLIHDCAYRKAWSKTDALAYIQENSGSHFDPAVVDAFLQLINQSQEGY